MLKIKGVSVRKYGYFEPNLWLSLIYGFISTKQYFAYRFKIQFFPSFYEYEIPRVYRDRNDWPFITFRFIKRRKHMFSGISYADTHNNSLDKAFGAGIFFWLWKVQSWSEEFIEYFFHKIQYMVIER